MTLNATLPYSVAGGAVGAIVLTRSIAALRVLGTGRAYARSKHALVDMARGAAGAPGAAPDSGDVHPTTVGTPMALNPYPDTTFRPAPNHRPSGTAWPEVRLNLLDVPFVAPEDIANAVASWSPMRPATTPEPGFPSTRVPRCVELRASPSGAAGWC